MVQKKQIDQNLVPKQCPLLTMKTRFGVEVVHFFSEVCTPKLMNSLKVGYSNVLGVATDVMRLEIGLSKLVGIVLYFLSQLKFG